MVQLSHGQQQLLHWSVVIHSGLLANKVTPLLIDEPELHLHPSALVTLMDALLEAAPKCQFIIATHNVSLIAHLAASFPRCTWFGKDGKFSKAGHTPPLVVEGLLGGKSLGDEVVDYCSMAERYAIATFAVDCLMSATSVPYKLGDPQIAQVIDHADPGTAHGRELVLLDFGAGQGRLLDGIAAARGDGEALATWLSYFAVEPDDVGRQACEQAIREHYADVRTRAFRSVDDALSGLGERAGDVVVLMNVLHEIHPRYWAQVCSSLQRLIREGGFLLIVEDTLLPRGELAHSCGFVVLESGAFRCLFDANSEGNVGLLKTTYSPTHGTRLQATRVSEALLSGVSTNTVRAALAMQKASALRALRALRSGNSKPTYLEGRQHAYHAQLVANIELALAEL
jgi:SAM-dependent methyltransferase